MPNRTSAGRQQYSQIARTPPHVSLADLRLAVGITIEEVCKRVEQETGTRPSRGTISAIENGHRGASVEMLAALALAYGLSASSIRTDYEPRQAPSISEPVPA